MPGFEIRSVPRQDTAVIHLRCRPDAISATMGEAFGKVFAAIGQAGAIPAGPVFSRYFEFGAEAVDFECGAAVTAPFSQLRMGQLRSEASLAATALEAKGRNTARDFQTVFSATLQQRCGGPATASRPHIRRRNR